MTEICWDPHEVVELASWDEALAKLLKCSTAHLLYRGQGDFAWPLSSSLARSLTDQARAGGAIAPELYQSAVPRDERDRHVHDVETQLLRAFITEADSLGIPGLPSHDDRLAWWEMMQHHGVPTRLLDWTRSPFIALWFAIRDPHCAEGNDAALWVFDSRTSWLNYAELIANLEKENSGWAEFQDDRKWQNHLAEQAILKKSPAPLIVNPRVAVSRVVAQQSVMTLTPYVGEPSAAHLQTILATKVRIRAEWKPEIIRICESFGLTQLNLFRDLDSLGKALAAKLSNNVPLSPVSLALRDWFNHSQADKPQS